jgi:hypothetical protein
MSFLDAVHAKIDSATDAIRGMIRRGVIKASTVGGRLQVAGATGENFDSVETLQQFGFKSIPPTGGEALLLLVDGDGNHAVAIGTADRTRPRSRLEMARSSGSRQAARKRSFVAMLGARSRLTWSPAKRWSLLATPKRLRLAERWGPHCPCLLLRSQRQRLSPK